MHVFISTIRTTKYIQQKKKCPLGGQVSARTCRTCVQKFKVYLLETAWALNFGAKNVCILRSCLGLLGFSVEWSFCLMFHFIFNIGMSDLGMFA